MNRRRSLIPSSYGHRFKHLLNQEAEQAEGRALMILEFAPSSFTFILLHFHTPRCDIDVVVLQRSASVSNELQMPNV